MVVWIAQFYRAGVRTMSVFVCGLNCIGWVVRGRYAAGKLMWKKEHVKGKQEGGHMTCTQAFTCSSVYMYTHTVFFLPILRNEDLIP